jgi:hypothetical protein
MDKHDAHFRVLFALALRDTFEGDGVGRKTGSESGEAIRWGHLFFKSQRPFRAPMAERGQA